MFTLFPAFSLYTSLKRSRKIKENVCVYRAKTVLSDKGRGEAASVLYFPSKVLKQRQKHAFFGGLCVRFSLLFRISRPASGDLAPPGWLKSNRSPQPAFPAAPPKPLIGSRAACCPAVGPPPPAAASAQPVSLFGLL